jgi:hypothetical protein
MDISEVLSCLISRTTKKTILETIKRNDYIFRTDVKVDIGNTEFELFIEVQNCDYNNYQVLDVIVIKIVFKGLVIYRSFELYNYKINLKNLDITVTKYDTIILDAIDNIIKNIYVALHLPTIKCSNCENYVFNTLRLTDVVCYSCLTAKLT